MFEKFDNKTILILGLIIIAILSLYVGEKDIALAVSGGLVGYLSKDLVDSRNQIIPIDSAPEEESEDYV